jgi:ketosteroid isomerase-like protein
LTLSSKQFTLGDFCNPMRTLSTLCIALLILQTDLCRADDTMKMIPEEFVARYQKALGTQRWQEVAPLIHPDCTVTFSSGACHQGKQKVQAAFQRNFDSIKGEEYAISDVHWVVKTDAFAVLTYSFNWSGIIQGEHASGTGRGTSTLIRMEEGWQLISEHLGPRP